jgi:hypothetical protein
MRLVVKSFSHLELLFPALLQLYLFLNHLLSEQISVFLQSSLLLLHILTVSPLILKLSLFSFSQFPQL